MYLFLNPGIYKTINNNCCPRPCPLIGNPTSSVDPHGQWRKLYHSKGKEEGGGGGGREWERGD